MAGPKTRATDTTAPDGVEPALERTDEEELIARVSATRQAGDEDPTGIAELLRRANDRNQAALDRLAR